MHLMNVESIEDLSECECFEKYVRLLLGPFTTVKGQCLMSFVTVESVKSRPINLFASKIVLCGFIALCAFAASPMSLSPSSVKATYDGVVL